MKSWFEKEGKKGEGEEGRKSTTDLWDIKTAIQKQYSGHDAGLVSGWDLGALGAPRPAQAQFQFDNHLHICSTAK